MQQHLRAVSIDDDWRYRRGYAEAVSCQAAESRSVAQPRRRKMQEAATLKSALEQPGFDDDLSSGDLFALARAGRDVTARAEAALRRRAKFPSRVGPELVLPYLDLPDVSSALRASAAWSKSADATFHAIADDKALTRRSPGESWRDLVRDSVTLRWIAAGPYHQQLWRFASRERFSSTHEELTGLGGPSVTIEGLNVFDTYVLGLGLPIRNAQSWRLEMVKDGHVIDGVGFAIRAADSLQVLHACVWNSDGELFDGSEAAGIDGHWLTQYTLNVADDEVYDTIAKFEIRVRKEADSALRVELWLRGNEENDLPPGTAHKLDSRLIDLTQPQLARRPNLIVGPFARIFQNSIATLSRV
mmetsp:Transcript_31580/g.97508  ORF Transcript_31580/g.97508 Transcript_31580/m.97508 type:complete len:358 (-) Transcript_31580:23-1096(-)